MSSEMKSTFYKINVHAALTPEQIWNHLKPAIDQAKSLRATYEHGADKAVSLHLPFVTVSHVTYVCIVTYLVRYPKLHVLGERIMCPFSYIWELIGFHVSVEKHNYTISQRDDSPFVYKYKNH